MNRQQRRAAGKQSAPREAQRLAARGRAHAVNGELHEALRLIDLSLLLDLRPETMHLRDAVARSTARMESIRPLLHASGTDATLLATLAGRYEIALAKSGTTPAGTLNEDPVLHARAFDALLAALTRRPLPQNVLLQDFGCGYGALFDRVANEPWFARGRYFGIDISPAMIETARARIDDPRAAFEVGSLLTETGDITLVHGTFNLKLNATDADWTRIVQDALRNIAVHTRTAFACTLLKKSANASSHMYEPDVGSVLSWCEALGWKAELLDDFSPRECAVLARPA